MPVNEHSTTIRALLNQEALATFRKVYPALSKEDQLAMVTAWERAVAAELRKVQKRPDAGMCTPRRRKNAG